MTVTVARPAANLRGAFVLFEGLLPTVIESQVLTHVRLVRELLGIDLTVIAFACTAEVHAQSAAALPRARRTAGGAVHLFRGIRPAVPGSAMVNRWLLRRALDRIEPFALLHARGDYAAAVTGPLACASSVPMLWDCRGDSRSELRERIGAVSFAQKVPLALRAWMSLQDLNAAGRTCAGACFVSQPLLELMAKYVQGKPSWVLPCLANEEEFLFDPALRKQVRAELGFQNGDPVYAYSGSLAGYQCFDEVVDTFKKIARANPTARLLVLTPYADAARKKLVAVPAARVRCMAVGHAEVNKYLNAADFGFLLRKDLPVNRVAFPTKVAEYAMAGLPVIMKQSPPSCVAEAHAIGNYLALDDVRAATVVPPAQRAAISQLARERMGRRVSMQRFAQIYHTLAQRNPVSAA